MSVLPDVGRIIYNGWRFPVESRTVAASVTPVLDSARRTVVYSKVTIAIETLVRALDLDPVLKGAIIALTHPGQSFNYEGRGAIPLTINIGGASDVLWGPVPEVVEMKPLGGGDACLLTWRVSTHLPLCAGARYTGPMEFNFGLTFTIAPNGNTQRVYSGHVIVANNRFGVNGRGLADTADRYREQINPDLLPGFRRTPGQFTLSEDKSRLDFAITDEQMGANIPPPGIFDVQADHTLTSDPKSYMVVWNGTLNATYELAKNGRTTSADARAHFFRLLRDRIGETLRMANARLIASPGDPIEQKKKPKETPKAVVIPTQFTLGEPEIFTTGGQKCRFSCTYSVVNVNLRKMLVASGLWRPSPDSNWGKWSTYLGNVIGPRGTARLRFDTREESIHDLCERRTTTVELNQASFGPPDRQSPSPPIPSDVFPEPRPDASWLHYENKIFLEVDDGTIPVVTLPTSPIDPKLGMLGGEKPRSPLGALWDAVMSQMPASQDGPVLSDQSSQSTDKHEVYKRKPTAFLYMRGSALRVRYDIPCPALLDVNGVKPVPANRANLGEGFASGVVANMGWPIVSARWNLRYFLPSVPTGPLPTLPNPLDGST